MASQSGRLVQSLLLSLALASVGGIARGQTSPPSPPPAAEQSGNAVATTQMAARFESLAAGISFTPPIGLREVRRPLPSEVVRYVDEARHWVLEVDRVDFTKAVPLANGKVRGIIDSTVRSIMQSAPGAEVLRQDQINVGTIDVGMIAARFKLATESNLTQRALVRRDDHTYYVFNLTTPVPPQGPVDADEPTRQAVAMFGQMVDSVRLLDQSTVRQDQDDRLFRTRALFVGLNGPKLNGLLVHEQWMRILQDGKDIGYQYVVEEPAKDLPRQVQIDREETGPDGILIGIRSRLYPRPGMQADQASWMWMSDDRKHERWSHLARAHRPGPSANDTMVGNMGTVDTIARYMKDPNLAVGEKTDSGYDANQPAVREVETLILTAKNPMAGGSAAPITRQLPVFYLPQPLGYVLPKLLADEGKRSFMFASWVPDRQEVMSRYVDILGEEEGELNGQPVHGIVIQDRFGLEGSITTTYVTAAGKFLGSYNADSKLTILPSDPDSLRRLWKDANLSRPEAIQANGSTTIEIVPQSTDGGPGGADQGQQH